MRKLKRLSSIGFLFLFVLSVIISPLQIVTAEENTQKDYATLIQTAIDNASANVIESGVTSEWEAIGLVKAGKEVPLSYHGKFEETLDGQVISKSGKGRMKITDVERLAMAAVAIGKDPINIDGKGFNLIEKIYESEPWIPGGDVDSLINQGNNGIIFALIALDTKDLSVPENAKWTRVKLVSELLKYQKEDGAWSLSTSTTGTASYDITAMALIGLAPYDQQVEVKQAVDKAVAFLSKEQGPTGGYNEAFVGGISSEATSQVIIGLTANGIDPTSDMFTKNGINLLDHLLSFQADDGGFKHTADDRSSNAMATEQALQALVAYKLFINGEGRLYQFNQMETTPELPIDEVPPVITVEGISAGTISTPELTFTVKVNDDVDGNITPEVRVNKIKLSPQQDGTFVAKLNKGKNTITISAVDKAGNKAKIEYLVTYQPANNIVEIGTPIIVEKNKQYSIGNTELLLPNDLPDGTKLVVSIPNESNVPYKSMLHLTGEIFEFSFEYPDGVKRGTGIYQLSMGVNEGIDVKKTGIYYYNELTGNWEYVGGWGTAKDGHISIHVDHFSTYGVFTDTDGPTDVQLTKKKTTSNSIMLGLAAQDPSGVKAYIIYRDGKQLAIVDGNKTEYLDSNLQADQAYEYKVIAVDELGNESKEVSISIATELTEKSGAPNNIDNDSSKNNTNDKNITNNKEEQSITGNRTANKNGSSRLPSTATNTFNLLLTGLVLITGGGIVLYARKKRFVKPE